MKRATAILLPALLTACGGGGGEPTNRTELLQTPAVNVSQDRTWYAQWQEGLPEYAEKTPEGWVIDMPTPKQQPHYYTMDAGGTLQGKTKVTLTYRVELADGAKIVPAKDPSAPSLLTLYLQRHGDDWTAKKETYRWWASFATVQGIQAGTSTVSARFDENWTSVLGTEAKDNPQAFADALRATDRIGFTLGGGDGLGHGVYATGPARIVIVDFKVE